MTEDKAIATRQVTEYLPDTISKEQAAFLLKSIWPKAPETDIIKAAILCKQYGLNPLMKQVFLIEFDKYDNGKKVGSEWAIVLGIKASRQIAQQALKKHGIRYSYLDGPRAMTESEQISIFGRTDKTKFWAITVLKDNQGALFPGYGNFPLDKKPYGTEKGNSEFNMAFIRSERNALDKMAPGELPDIETGDDTYIEGNFKEVLEKGEQQFTKRVEKDIKELWPNDEPKKLAEPEPVKSQAPPQPPATEVRAESGEGSNKGSGAQSSRFDWDWVAETLKLINWKESTAKSWLVSQFKVKMLPQLADMLEELPPDNLKVFTHHIQAMRESSGQ